MIISRLNKIIIELLILLCAVPTFGATLEVGSGQTYETISTAVTAASDDDLIYIHNGTYHETISTTKDLDFEGESQAGVIVTLYEEAVGSPSWSKTDGYSYVYECTASSIVSSGTVTGIVDEDRRGVYQEMTSIAEVDAIPGRHYTTGGVLYVRCPDDADPSTHTLWFTTESAVSTISLTSSGGQGDVSNMTIVGGIGGSLYTSPALSITDTAANIGTVTLSNLSIYCGSLSVIPSDYAVGGTLNATNVDILYAITPVYDIDYAVHTNEDSESHTYRGAGATWGSEDEDQTNLRSLETVNFDQGSIRFTRNGFGFAGNTLNVTRSLLTDFVVHSGEIHNPNSSAAYTFSNNIFAMHGSTLYVPASHIDSDDDDGATWYLINNTIYSGEASKQFFDPTEAAADTSYVDDTKVYLINNLFAMDYLCCNFDGALDGDNINMDYNYYAVGNSGDFIRHNGISYTLSEWQAFTDGEGWSMDDNSYSSTSLSTVFLLITDETDGGNANFGKVGSESPVIGAATAIYAPATDYFGASRSSGVGDDIGAHEYYIAREDSSGRFEPDFNKKTGLRVAPNPAGDGFRIGGR